MSMSNETRERFNAYLARQAELNGLPPTPHKFTGTVTPTVQQTLESKAREQSNFLNRINVVGVDELNGQKIGLSIGSTIAGRTDTSTTGTRATSDPSSLAAQTYALKKTNFDTHLTYAKLDAWAKFPDFQARISNLINEQITNDRIMIGFNGTSVADTTNRTTNSLLQDVNKGWLQYLRDNRTTQHTSSVKVGEAPDASQDYNNLDALAFDAISLLEAPFREATDLVLICARSLVKDKYLSLIQSNDVIRKAFAGKWGTISTGSPPIIRLVMMVLSAFTSVGLSFA